MSLLTVENLRMQFGGLVAVDNVHFSLEPHQIAAIIGPNGAGKTTVFNCISGFYQPSGGQITLDGEDITGLPSHRIAQKGLTRTFQNIRLFREMTVLENLLVAAATETASASPKSTPPNGWTPSNCGRLPTMKRAASPTASSGASKSRAA